MNTTTTTSSSILVILTSLLLVSALSAHAAEPTDGVVSSGNLAFNFDYADEFQAHTVDRHLSAQGQSTLLSDGLKLALPFAQPSEAGAARSEVISPELLKVMGLSGEFVAADISQKFQPVSFGLSHRSVEANYLGSEFLSFTQWAPHVTGYIGENLALRTDYIQSHKTLAGRPGREASVDSLAASISWFLNSAKAYFSFGAKYDDENAVDPDHDFNANTINLKLAKYFPFMTRDGIFKIGASYEQRQYKNGLSELGEPREEGRTRYQAELELPLTQQLQLILNAEFADHESNFDAEEREKYITGAELSFSF